MHVSVGPSSLCAATQEAIKQQTRLVLQHVQIPGSIALPMKDYCCMFASNLPFILPKICLNSCLCASHANPAAAGVAFLGSQAQQCEPSGGPLMTFFPDGAENQNIPTAWGRTAQTAAGNTATDQLYTIALTSTNNIPGTLIMGVPVLQVLPKHPLLGSFSSVDQECLGPGTTQRRRLQAVDGVVSTKATVVISYQLNISQVVTAFSGNELSPVPKIKLLDLSQLKDVSHQADHCLLHLRRNAQQPW